MPLLPQSLHESGLSRRDSASPLSKMFRPNFTSLVLMPFGKQPCLQLIEITFIQ